LFHLDYLGPNCQETALAVASPSHPFVGIHTEVRGLVPKDLLTHQEETANEDECRDDDARHRQTGVQTGPISCSECELQEASPDADFAARVSKLPRIGVRKRRPL
jgi:hypothetical protein